MGRQRLQTDDPLLESRRAACRAYYYAHHEAEKARRRNYYQKRKDSPDFAAKRQERAEQVHRYYLAHKDKWRDKYRVPGERRKMINRRAYLKCKARKIKEKLDA